MQSLPPEILALIVAEMWRSGTALSSVSLAWPDIVPVVREQRFQHLQVSGLRRTAGLITIIDSTPEISTVIRTIHANSTSEKKMARESAELINLLSKIGNLERLSLHCLRYDFPDTLPAYANLTTLSLSDVRMSYLSDLLDPMHSMPHLSHFSSRRLTIGELYKFASSVLKIYPRKLISLWDGDDGFVPSTQVPVPQVHSLSLSITSYADAILLDLISSTKSPFPNIEEITILCNFYKDWPHFPLLLRRYDSSLRVLRIAEDVVESGVVLTLPTALEYFKFSLGSSSLSLDIAYQAMLSAQPGLKVVTMRLTGRVELSKVGKLDEVMAGMDLDKLYIECEESKWEAVDAFPRCLRRETTNIRSYS